VTFIVQVDVSVNIFKIWSSVNLWLSLGYDTALFERK